MSEKIVQLNEEVIKSELKELVRGCRCYNDVKQSGRKKIANRKDL